MPKFDKGFGPDKPEVCDLARTTAKESCLMTSKTLSWPQVCLITSPTPFRREKSTGKIELHGNGKHVKSG